MSGTGFPQTKFLLPNGEISQSWRFFLQNVYQATGGGSPVVTAASVSFTPSGTITVADVQSALAQLDSLKVPATRQVNGHNLSADVTVTKGDVGLVSVTNDAQTKAAIVPNTVPSSGQVLVGNAGGTAYAPVGVSGDAALASTGALTVSQIGGKAVSLAGSLTTVGAFASTFTMTGVTTVTYPTSGTLAVVSGALGTPTSITLTNGTGLPISTGVSGLAAGVATFLATPTSANLITAVTDETGTGALVFANTPTLVTPNIGAATGTSLAATSFVKTGSTVVGSLPAAATAGAGARMFVTDATATTFLSTVAGGGANKVPVVSDGTSWLIG